MSNTRRWTRAWASMVSASLVATCVAGCGDDHAEFVERAREALEGNPAAQSLTDDEIADIGTAVCLIGETDDPAKFQDAVAQATWLKERVASQEDWERLLAIAKETLCPGADI